MPADTRELARRATELRARLAPPTIDPELSEACDIARRLLDPAYRRDAEMRDDIAAGRRSVTGLTVDQVVREARTIGLTWEHRHCCPDCYCFRAPGSPGCPNCRSTGRPIPAHERSRASAETQRRARARRAAKRRK